MHEHTATLQKRLSCLSDTVEFCSSVCTQQAIVFAGLLAPYGVHFTASRAMMR